MKSEKATTFGAEFLNDVEAPIYGGCMGYYIYKNGKAVFVDTCGPELLQTR